MVLRCTRSIGMTGTVWAQTADQVNDVVDDV